MRTFWCLVFSLSLFTCAQAQNGSDTAAIVAWIKAEARGCTLSVQPTGMLSFRAEKNLFEYVSLWSYFTEGCNGGNNWQTLLRAFYVRGDGSRLVVKPIQLDLTSIGVGFANYVEAFKTSSTDRRSNEGALLRDIEIDMIVLEDGDSRCCPTGGRRVRFWIDNGSLRFSVVKRWKKD